MEHGTSIFTVPYLPRRYEGYRKLWVKVIIRAIYDYVYGRDSTNQYNRLHANTAYAWIFKAKGENSLENVCKFLGLDAEQFRTYVRTVKKSDLKRLRLTDRDVDEVENRYAEEDEDSPAV